MLVVKKFGGTSVGNKERIFNVAKRCIEEYQQGNDVVVSCVTAPISLPFCTIGLPLMPCTMPPAFSSSALSVTWITRFRSAASSPRISSISML